MRTRDPLTGTNTPRNTRRDNTPQSHRFLISFVRSSSGSFLLLPHSRGQAQGHPSAPTDGDRSLAKGTGQNRGRAERGPVATGRNRSASKARPPPQPRFRRQPRDLSALGAKAQIQQSPPRVGSDARAAGLPLGAERPPLPSTCGAPRSPPPSCRPHSPLPAPPPPAAHRPIMAALSERVISNRRSTSLLAIGQFSLLPRTRYWSAGGRGAGRC